MKILYLFAFLFLPFALHAQYQIAVYHPADKTTKIAPTFDSAYTVAQGGDYIYLPAGNFTVTYSIAKKLNIIGVGFDADSSKLGTTSFSAQLDLEPGSEYSFIEGINFLIGFNLGSSNINFQRCYINSVYIGSSVVAYSSFNECIIGGAGGSGSNITGSNWTFSKCIIIQNIIYLTNSTFINNIFGIDGSANSYLYYIFDSQFYNNIFNGQIIDNSSGGSVINCSFINNINTNLTYPSSNVITGDYTVPWSSIFVSAKPDSVYQSNYHLASGNPAINGGNDGTDVGIYGTGQPCKPGWIPSNPHVYYQKVTVDANGILHATFKVQPQTY